MEEDLQEEHKDLVVPPVTEIPQSHLGNPTEIYHEAEGFTSDDEDSDIPTKSPPTPDPMAGIGYWESPGNSPKLIRKWSPKICRSVQSAIAALKEDILSEGPFGITPRFNTSMYSLLKQGDTSGR